MTSVDLQSRMKNITGSQCGRCIQPLRGDQLGLDRSAWSFQSGQTIIMSKLFMCKVIGICYGLHVGFPLKFMLEP